MMMMMISDGVAFALYITFLFDLHLLLKDHKVHSYTRLSAPRNVTLCSDVVCSFSCCRSCRINRWL